MSLIKTQERYLNQSSKQHNLDYSWKFKDQNGKTEKNSQRNSAWHEDMASRATTTNLVKTQQQKCQNNSEVCKVNQCPIQAQKQPNSPLDLSLSSPSPTRPKTSDQLYQKALNLYQEGQYQNSNNLIDKVLESKDFVSKSNMSIFKFLNYYCLEIKNVIQFDLEKLIQQFTKAVLMIIQNQNNQNNKRQKMLFVCSLVYHLILTKKDLICQLYFKRLRYVDVSCFRGISTLVQNYHLQFLQHATKKHEMRVRRNNWQVIRQNAQKIKIFKDIISTFTQRKFQKYMASYNKLVSYQFTFGNLNCVFVNKNTTDNDNWLKLFTRSYFGQNEFKKHGFGISIFYFQMLSTGSLQARDFNNQMDKYRDQLDIFIIKYQMQKSLYITLQTDKSVNTSLEFDLGIDNIGNTCYMNSVLQCLHKSRYFTTQFDKQYSNLKQESNRISGLGLSRAVQGFLTEISQPKLKFASYYPRQIKKQVQKSNLQFQGYHQNDSIEFFSTFMGILNQELDTSPKGKGFLKIDHYSNDIKSIYEKTKQNDEIRSKSICDETFTGRYKVTYKCQVCHKNYVLFQKFNFHYLDIPSQPQETYIYRFYNPNLPQPTLLECFREFQKSSRLQGDNMMACDNCTTSTVSNKTMQIYEANKILVICFKRFLERYNMYNVKNHTAINIPHILSIKDILDNYDGSQYQNKHYKLSGAILHRGGLHGGHYNAICFNYESKNWVNYNDSYAQRVYSLDLRDAYILFYELMDIGCDNRQATKIISNIDNIQRPVSGNLVKQYQYINESLRKVNGSQIKQSNPKYQQIKPEVSLIANNLSEDLVSLDCAIQCLFNTQYFDNLFKQSTKEGNCNNNYEELLFNIFQSNKNNETYRNKLRNLQDFLSQSFKKGKQKDCVLIIQGLITFLNQFKYTYQIRNKIGIQIEQTSQYKYHYIKTQRSQKLMLELPIQKDSLAESLKIYCQKKRIFYIRNMLIIHLTDPEEKPEPAAKIIPEFISPCYFTSQLYCLRSVLCYDKLQDNKPSAYLYNRKDNAWKHYSNRTYKTTNNPASFQGACLAIYQLFDQHRLYRR